MYCMPAPFAVSCSSMQCKNSNLMLGNVTAQQSSAGCNVTSCSYSGFVNGTISTTYVSFLFIWFRAFSLSWVCHILLKQSFDHQSLFTFHRLSSNLQPRCPGNCSLQFGLTLMPRKLTFFGCFGSAGLL